MVLWTEYTAAAAAAGTDGAETSTFSRSLSLSLSRSISGSLLFSRTTAAVQNQHLFYFPFYKNQDGI